MRTLPLALTLALLSACSADADPTLDPADAPFLVDGKADSIGIDLTDDEACAVLKLATLADQRTLDKDVRLNAQAAKAIVAARAGRTRASADDDLRFDSLARLDAVKYVGPAAFRTMVEFVRKPKGAAFRCADVPVQLLAFNDFHGAIEPPTGSGGKIRTSNGDAAAVPAVPPTDVDAGGAEFLATHLAALRKDHPNTVTVAAGDCIGATPLLSAAFHDEPAIESLDALGLDIAAVGNHEFDEGIEELWRMQYGGAHAEAPDEELGWDGDGFEGARYQYLAANVIYDEDGETVFPGFTVRRFGHAWVAFIGMTLEGTPDVVTAQGVDGLTFLDEVETANRLAREIQALGVQTIVVLVHEGGASTGLYNECAGISGPLFDIVKGLDEAIDVVVAGHTNAAHVCDIEGRIVTSAAHNGRLVSDIDLVIDERTGDVKSMRAANVIVTRDVEKDAAQTRILEKWKALVAPISNRVVATIGQDLTKVANAAGESVLGGVIADAQLSASPGAKIAFMNPGGIRTDLVVAQVSGGEKPGEITYGELFAVQPFSNNLVLFDLTGAQIERALEEQWYDFGKGADRGTKAAVLQVSAGFSYAVQPSRAAGDRVDPASITLDGQPLDPTATYRVVANVFLAGGGDGFPTFKAGTSRASGVFDLEALERFLTGQPGFLPSGAARIRVQP